MPRRVLGPPPRAGCLFHPHDAFLVARVVDENLEAMAITLHWGANENFGLAPWVGYLELATLWLLALVPGGHHNPYFSPFLTIFHFPYKNPNLRRHHHLVSSSRQPDIRQTLGNLVGYPGGPTTW